MSSPTPKMGSQNGFDPGLAYFFASEALRGQLGQAEVAHAASADHRQAQPVLQSHRGLALVEPPELAPGSAGAWVPGDRTKKKRGKAVAGYEGRWVSKVAPKGNGAALCRPQSTNRTKKQQEHV